MSNHRFLVIGCGSIGRRHITNLLTLGERDIVGYDPREDRRAAAAALGIKVVGDMGCAWDGRDAVIVAVPSSLHVPIAIEAVARGCDVLVEKPLSHSPEGVEQLLQSARSAQTVGLVGCNIRFHPGVQQIKRLVDSGEVGRVIAARAEVGYYLPEWRPADDYRATYSAKQDLGGGIILDAIHEIDYMLWLFGHVTDVMCVASKLSRLEIDVEDTAAILLEFENGTIGELHLDYIQRAYSRDCRVIGDDGTIHWDFVTGQVRLFTARAKRWETVLECPTWAVNDMYVAEMQHFVRCLDRVEQPLAGLEDGAEALAVALAAKRSAASKKAERPCGPLAADTLRKLS